MNNTTIAKCHCCGQEMHALDYYDRLRADNESMLAENRKKVLMEVLAHAVDGITRNDIIEIIYGLLHEDELRRMASDPDLEGEKE